MVVHWSNVEPADHRLHLEATYCQQQALSKICGTTLAVVVEPSAKTKATAYKELK